MRLRTLPHKQRGQSMTEFVVAASFVMVPLFIIVPTVGKYIDMKQATVQAARYSSWEYTANYISLKDQPDGFTAISRSQLPQKSSTVVANEARQRFFSKTDMKISSTIDKGGYDSGSRNPLWTFHNGLPMYIDKTNNSINVNGSDPTPEKFRVFGRVVGFIGTATGFIGNLLQAVGLNVGFDAIDPDRNISVDGLFTANFNIPVEEAPTYTALKTANKKPLFGSELDLVMTAKSGILTESWGAGGKKQTVFQAGGLIPTSLLSGGVGKTIQSVLSFIAPSLHPSSLKFGYPVNDPKLMDEVPVGAIENDSRTLECTGGKCEQ